MGLNAIIFQKYVQNARNQLIAEYKKQYASKKGDRFNHEGVTYEIANFVANQQEPNQFDFELSSKIPVEEISVDIKTYFKEVEKQLGSKSLGFKKLTVEDRVKKIDAQEVKQTDYIRQKFSYQADVLYDKKQLAEKLAEIERSGESDLAGYPEVSTLAGKVVLDLVYHQFYDITKQNIEKLIAANQQVFSKFKK